MTHFFRLLGALLLFSASGCGDSQVATVSGTVTLDGQPLDQGVVVFEDLVKGISVNAPIQTGGGFIV
ncbi:MAG: hypothetical protein U1E05_08105, partial [Patescibacteria group bacterium]|nr:hypothetical protein [Patescibacteria group bacterium]